MPESETNEEVVKPKRAPRKRVAKTAVKKAPAKPRKTAVKKAPVRTTAKPETSTNATESADSTPRKAPTAFASQKHRQKQKQKHFIVIAIILLIGVGASAAVGFTDKGQINVSQVIEERNQRIASGTTDERDGDAQRIEVPVQNTNKQANGGLVGLGTGGAKPQPPTEAASTTATTTDATASSTDLSASSTAPNADSATSTQESDQEPAGTQPETEQTTDSLDSATTTTP